MPVHALGSDRPHVPASAWIAPGAQVAGRVFLGEEVGIWFNALARGDVDEIRIGRESNIQDGCILHVDSGDPLRIGERVTVGHRAILHGCSVEDDVLIGMGAIVLNRARVGRGSIVAAGALVLEGQIIPPFSLVAGLPALVKRSLPEDETLSRLRASAAHYVELQRRYRAELKEGGNG